MIASIPEKVLAVLLVGIATAHSQEFEAVKTQDTGAGLVNPAMGWTMHFYSNVPTNYGSKLSPADTLDDFAGYDKRGKSFPITDYALSKGVNLRDDSILVMPPPRSWYHAELAQAFWPKMPVILEHEHYQGSKERKAWKGELLLNSVEDYHASFMSIHGWPRDILNENRDIIKQINQRMGYRIQPAEVIWTKNVKIGESFSFKVKSTWANKGVAPCYPGGFPCLTLKDAKGGIVSVLTDESLNMRSLTAGPPGEAPLTVLQSKITVGFIAPTTTPGTYDLFISVGSRDGTPQIALPLAADDGQRRYRLGSVTLQ